MSKKWSQFDPFSALTGAEEIVGLQGGANKRGALNGVFKTYFDTLYWPLGGTADLTSSVTIDGNGHDITFGDPNLIGSFLLTASSNIGFNGDVFSVEASSQIVWTVDDGVDLATYDFGANQGFITSPQFHINTETSFEASADDGVDASSITVGAASIDFNGVELNVFGASGLLLHGDLAGDAIEVGNSSTGQIQLGSGIITFTAPILLHSFTVATAPSASPAPQFAYCSDESGGAIPVFSDGTNWRRVTDGSIIS